MDTMNANGQQGQQGSLLQLFLQDQALLNEPGSSGAGGLGLKSPQGDRPSTSSSAGQAPQQQALGWGGQPINDSNGYKVPWFGRRRGAAGHRARQCRNSPVEGAGGAGPSPNGSSSRDGGHLPLPPFASSSQPQDALSVEEIVQLLKKTPRADPCPARVFSSLHNLDSRTVALLLKDISKAGLDSRSIELFDWLRSLPERHLLRHLCDVFTYTAMISLCIYQQNVDRAMELLEEMRQRGVERNVHTYTALMNVCIKCGKLSASLDIFVTMKAEGCTPNVVTYNTLIDVYGKLGQWDRAVGVLSMMRAEGVTPALRTFNTLIIACNMCNQPREALAVYQELRDSGFEANSTTYNALISAYGKLGQLDRVLEVYKDMVWRGLERSVITYSSLISACEKAGRWETALQLFDEMQRDGCTPNTVTYNSLITACGQGAQWEKARKVFQQMQGCQPDVVTYTALISAYERGGQWLVALEAFEEMVARGCWPDAIVYNAIIDALWQTGVVWAQAKARELFAMAVKQGHFRNERMSLDGHRAELNLHALTAGVAMLSMQSFLQDLHNKVKAKGDAALPRLVAIVTDAGSASKEQGNFIIKDAASTSMSLWGSPFRPVQDRTYLGLLEASGPQVAAWMRSSSFTAMMASLFPPLPDAAALQQPHMVKQLELAAQKDCQLAFEAVRRFEASHNLQLQNMGMSFLQQRGALVGSILQKGGQLRLPDEVVHDAVLLLDRAGSTGVQVPQEVLPVVAAAVLLIAAQQSSGGIDDAAKLSLSAGPIADAFGVEAQSVLDMAWQLRQVLQNDTVAISAMRCLKVYMERMGCGQLDRQFLYLVAGLPMMLAVEAQFDTTLLNCRPSVVAAALLYAERRQRGAVPFWPSMLAKLTGYEDLTTPELACAVRSAQKLCRKAHYTQLYKAQSNQLAARLMGPPPAASQPQAQLGLQLSALLGQQGVQQQQQQQQTMGLVSGMQSDAVVAAPQLNRAPSVSLPPCGLGLQPSLSGPLSSRGLSASSAGSSSTAGVAALASLRAASGMASPAPGVLGLQGNSGSGAGLMSAMQGATTLQHNQVDLALLTQLQLQHEQQRQQQQQQQQQQQHQQQQLSAAGLLGPASMQLGGGAGFGLDLTSSLQAAGLYGSGANGLRTGGLVAGGGDGSSLGGFAASTASPFTISLQAPVLQQAQPQEQDGLESLAMTLSALGLHGSVHDTMSTAALEVALRQQC